MLATEWLSKNEPGRVVGRKKIETAAGSTNQKFTSQKPTHQEFANEESQVKKVQPDPQRAVPWSEKFPKKGSPVSEPAVKGMNNSIETLPGQNSNSSPSRYIPAAVRREVWSRDGARCTHCLSTYALEIDHVVSFALGGESGLDNLRILCRSCNQYEAVRVFGSDKAAPLPRK